MTAIGHNGGPPVADDGSRMSYVKFFPSDFLSGTAHMSLEMRGAYITVLCVMYDRLSGFPYDEQLGSTLLRVDRRVYRRVRDALIAEGKFYRDGDFIYNRRVENEIRLYLISRERRSKSARHARKASELHRTSGELRPDFRRTSAGSSPEVREKSGELFEENHENSMCAPQKEGLYARALPESRIQNPDIIPSSVVNNLDAARETNVVAASDLSQLQDKLLAACNGALDNPVNCQGLLNLSIPQMWIDQGADLERDILPTLTALGKRHHGKRIRSWDYFTPAVAEAKARREAGLPKFDPVQQPKRLTAASTDWSRIGRIARGEEVRK